MKVPFYDLRPVVATRKLELMEAIERVLDSGVFVGGNEVESFENAFAESVGSKYCVAVGNGLDAIRILLEAHNIGAGDEVIVPAFTFYATWLAVMQTGAIPVAVDVSYQTAGIDPGQIQSAITSRTKAILVVHLFGISVDMDSVNSIAKNHGLLVFEDAAQAHFGKTNAGNVGNSCDGAAFSFYPTKNLGALGDAGAITTNSEHVVETARSRRSYGFGSTKYDHVDTGWNSRLDPIQAAVLSLSLEASSEITSRRREIATRYIESLGQSCSDLVFSGIENSVFHHFVLKKAQRQDIRKEFAKASIGTDIHYPYSFNSLAPIAIFLKQAGFEVGRSFRNSELLSEQVFSLPMGNWMSETQVNYVSKAIETLRNE